MPSSSLPPTGRGLPRQVTGARPLSSTGQAANASKRPRGAPPPPIMADQPPHSAIGAAPSARAGRGAPGGSRKQAHKADEPAQEQPLLVQATDAGEQTAKSHAMQQIFSMLHEAVAKAQDFGVRVGEMMMRGLDIIGTRV
jgi:hypothetical protein